MQGVAGAAGTPSQTVAADRAAPESSAADASSQAPEGQSPQQDQAAQVAARATVQQGVGGSMPEGHPPEPAHPALQPPGQDADAPASEPPGVQEAAPGTVVSAAPQQAAAEGVPPSGNPVDDVPQVAASAEAAQRQPDAVVLDPTAAIGIEQQSEQQQQRQQQDEGLADVTPEAPHQQPATSPQLVRPHCIEWTCTASDADLRVCAAFCGACAEALYLCRHCR